jgi:hypothetical protein
MLVDGSGQIKMTKVGHSSLSVQGKLTSRTERCSCQKCRSR